MLFGSTMLLIVIRWWLVVFFHHFSTGAFAFYNNSRFLPFLIKMSGHFYLDFVKATSQHCERSENHFFKTNYVICTAFIYVDCYLKRNLRRTDWAHTMYILKSEIEYVFHHSSQNSFEYNVIALQFSLIKTVYSFA